MSNVSFRDRAGYNRVVKAKGSNHLWYNCDIEVPIGCVQFIGRLIVVFARIGDFAHVLQSHVSPGMDCYHRLQAYVLIYSLYHEYF